MSVNGGVFGASGMITLGSLHASVVVGGGVSRIDDGSSTLGRRCWSACGGFIGCGMLFGRWGKGWNPGGIVGGWRGKYFGQLAQCVAPCVVNRGEGAC